MISNFIFISHIHHIFFLQSESFSQSSQRLTKPATRPSKRSMFRIIIRLSLKIRRFPDKSVRLSLREYRDDHKASCHGVNRTRGVRDVNLCIAFVPPTYTHRPVDKSFLIAVSEYGKDV